MLFRPMMSRDHGVRSVLAGSRLTYSMWQGYLKDGSTQRVREWLEENRIPLDVIHTSGHASVVDLSRFAASTGAASARSDPFIRDGAVR